MEEYKVRLDLWLWAARFYKTRALAKEAINKGQVDCNKDRAKASKLISVGDSLIIHKPPYEYQIKVLSLSSTRGPYSVAKLLYEETTQSLEQRAKVAELQKISHQSFKPPPQKPDKHDRRLLRKFREKD